MLLTLLNLPYIIQDKFSNVTLWEARMKDQDVKLHDVLIASFVVITILIIICLATGLWR
jgi:hypothetical protein